jgi:hypothetical protein
VAGKVDHHPEPDKSKPSLFFASGGSVFALWVEADTLTVEMGALRDCEAVVHSILGQPVNTITAFAFVVGGMVVIMRSDRLWVGVATIATGIGSILFHGPMPPYAEWAHDFTLAWLLLVVASRGRAWERWAHAPGLAVLAAVIPLPGAADPVTVALASVAIVALVMQDRSSTTMAPLTLLVVVATVGRLGATGGPLCVPESIWQPHGLWHIGAATAVTWWALATDTGNEDG